MGKAIATHLHPEGYVHAQVLPSLAYNTAGIVHHALRLVRLYELAEIPRDRVCIKIPSTSEGIAACSQLETQHNVRTLATTCFTMAQGLAAAQAKCTYVAPYVNPLIAHIDPSRYTAYDDPLPSLTGLQVTLALQQAFKRMNASTKVMAASLFTAEECTALSGIDHITISASALALLQKTAWDARFQGIRDRSYAYMESDHEHPDNGYWTNSLEEALKDSSVAALLEDALEHFGKAEKDLRGMAQKELRQ